MTVARKTCALEWTSWHGWEGKFCEVAAVDPDEKGR